MAPFSVTFSGPPCEGGGGWGSGFGVRGVGTVAPRVGGQCAATKTRKKDNAQGRFCEGLRLVLRSPPCGLGTCRFCNAKGKKQFLNNWKNLNSVRHSSLGF